jgi:hypothetical protein
MATDATDVPHDTRRVNDPAYWVEREIYIQAQQQGWTKEQTANAFFALATKTRDDAAVWRGIGETEMADHIIQAADSYDRAGHVCLIDWSAVALAGPNA